MAKIFCTQHVCVAAQKVAGTASRYLYERGKRLHSTYQKSATRCRDAALVRRAKCTKKGYSIIVMFNH